MKLYLLYTLAAIVVLGPAAPGAVTSNSPGEYVGQGVSIEMSRPAGSVLNPGDEIGFRLQADQDGYLVVFNIDTEGFVNLLYPARGERPVRVREGDTYVIPEDSRETLVVEGITGVEFVFALIVPDRDDIARQELDYFGKANELPREERYRIEGDPFIAANMIAGELVRGISYREGVFLDYTHFFVNERVVYPCYLCGECEGLEPDPVCADFIVASNFDPEGPFRYPLRRAYEMIEPAAAPVVEDDIAAAPNTGERVFGQYASDDGTVNINFYPYNAEVYYETRESLTGGADVNIHVNQWDPYWYDPWYAGWYYAPRASFGFYWGYPSFWWGFNWGYWGGYYCSSWYWPRCYAVYDCYRYNYRYYDGGYRYRPERYKDKYDGGDLADRRTGYKEKTARPDPFHTTYAQTSRRDSRLRVASPSLSRSGASSATRVKSRTAYDNGRGVASRSTYGKSTRVRNFGGTSRHSYAAKSTRAYKPRTRSSYGRTSAVSRSGKTGYTRGYTGTRNRSSASMGVGSYGTRNKSSYRPVTRRSTGSSFHRSRSGSVYQRSTPASRSLRRTTGSPSRTSKSVFSRPSRSPSSHPSSGSTYKRSGGSSRSGGRSAVKSSSRSSSSGSKARSSGRSGGSRSKSKSGGKGRR